MKKWKFITYDGSLSSRSAKNRDVSRAYSAWKNQRERCNNENHSNYRWYGARGIRVEYSAREFIGWYLYQLAIKRPDKPSVGRIDHSKNYRLDNIELVEQSENSKEMRDRCGPGVNRRVKVTAVVNRKIRLHFDSIGECARVCGINTHLLEKHMAGKLRSPIQHFVFRYTNVARRDGKARR